MQKENVLFLIFAIKYSSESITDFNFSHLWKAKSPIDLIDLTIIIDSKLLQNENTLFPIFVTEDSSENTTDFNCLQLKNPYSSIDLTNFGITIISNLLNPENEWLLIDKSSLIFIFWSQETSNIHMNNILKITLLLCIYKFHVNLNWKI